MNGMTLKSPIKGISNPILELKTEPHIEILVSLTPSSPDLRFRQMLVMLSESGGGSNLVGEGLGEERASRPDEVALRLMRLTAALSPMMFATVPITPSSPTTPPMRKSTSI
jgi:hypothetical protein